MGAFEALNSPGNRGQRGKFFPKFLAYQIRHPVIVRNMFSRIAVNDSHRDFSRFYKQITPGKKVPWWIKFWFFLPQESATRDVGETSAKKKKDRYVIFSAYQFKINASP